MDEAKLQEIEARANAATPGPWYAGNGHPYVTTERMGFGIVVARALEGNDCTFIAHVRTDVPDLLAEVRRLTAALDAVTTERDEHCRPVQVVAGIAVRNGCVLLIRSKRHGVATPGGKVRVGETHADALRRELREETGLEVVRVGRYLHTDVQPAFQCHLYAVEVSEGEPVAGDDAEAAWWGDPAEILASSIPRDYPLVLDVIRNGIGAHDDVPWFDAALATARREGAEEMRSRCAAEVSERMRSALREAKGFHADDLGRDCNEAAGYALEEAADAIRALPLDAPGGAT